MKLLKDRWVEEIIKWQRVLHSPGPDLPYGFLGFSPGPHGLEGPPAKLSQSKMDDMRKNRKKELVVRVAYCSVMFGD
ncbi:hypothetical protein EVAR_66001_1 [Eumeta japonica]|uniref:Uncharacterized protein n=1 Tax=Eumeta variegata TaxID=151549 RepID=A0A4C1ZT12_EUMVA|nr:hypothetical protein EVAR_66001_1 [Eumeta japonica]